MAVNPINYTRVTTNLQAMSLLESLRRNTLNIFTEQKRLASGLRLLAPSDDPALAGQAIRLSEVLESQEQILTNVRNADAFLAATDTGMSDINELITEARTIASSMVGSDRQAEERASQAEIVRSIINQLVAVGNRTYNGMYLFGGRQTQSAPFVARYGGVTYVGDTSDFTVDIGDPADTAINLSGDALFGMTTGKLAGYRNLEPAVEPDTRLQDLKGATALGVRPGRLEIRVNGGATAFTADLSQAATVGDVVDGINAAWRAAGGSSDLASIAGTGLRLDTAGGGDIEVREVANGTVASDLGLLRASATGVVAGDSLRARVTGTTPIAALAGGAGIDLSRPILIINGEQSAVVDLSRATTVQDVLNAINAAEVGVQASINRDATGIDVVNRVSGTVMRIVEQGGSTADGLGILTLHRGRLLADLNQGRGVSTAQNGADFRVISADGTSFDVSLRGATTVQDVLDRINGAAATARAAVRADLNPAGAGLRIDDSSGGAGTLRIERLNLSPAVDDLGLNKNAAAGQTYVISDDVAGVRAASVFSALMDLEAGLRNDDTARINAAGQELERLSPELIRLRGVVGGRSKAMNDRLRFTEDAVQATRTLLSEVKDLDYTEAVTRFQQAQTILQANLMTGSRMLSLSLLDFLQ